MEIISVNLTGKSRCDKIIPIKEHTVGSYYLKNRKYSSISQQNQYISSIKLLYKYVVGCNLKRFYIERPRKNKTLPKVNDKTFILNRIKSINRRYLLST